VTDAHKKVDITSYNQSGGITAHTVTVNMAPQPNVKHDVIETSQENGVHITKVRLTLTSGYAAGALRVLAEASSLLNFTVRPPMGGAMSNMREGISYADHPNLRGFEVGSPLNDTYIVTLRTGQPEAVTLDAQLL
jgi:hypothetical protein